MQTFNIENETKERLSALPESGLLDFLLHNNLIDKERMRNAIIIKEFDKRAKAQNRFMTDIYDDLASEFDLSYARIRQLIRNRLNHEINFC